MEWSHKWGEHVNSGFYYNLQERGLLKEADLEPPVGPFDFYLDAFQELGSCRNNTMSLGAIPFTAIMEYSRLFDVGDSEEFHYLIRAMDNRLLSLEFQKSKNGTAGTGKDGSTNSSTPNSNKRRH